MSSSAGTTKTAARLWSNRREVDPPALLGSTDQPYPALLAYSPLPVIVYARASSRIVAVSDSAVACYGYSREAFEALTIMDLFPAEEIPSLKRFLEANLSRERPGRIEAVLWRHRRKDATIIDVEVTGDDLEYHGQSCRVLFCQDVTEQHKAAVELHEARERLRASEERYRLLFEQNPQPMVAHDRETLQIVAANNAMVTSYGYSREELLAMTHRRSPAARGCRAAAGLHRGHTGRNAAWSGCVRLAPSTQGRHDHRYRGHQRERQPGRARMPHRAVHGRDSPQQGDERAPAGA